MKINDNKVFAGDVSYKISAGVSGEKKAPKNKSKGSTVDGTTIRSKFDPIAAKKEEAQKRAMKIVGDAFSKDVKVDTNLENRREKVRGLETEKLDNMKSIAGIEARRASLAEKYRVDDDSKEAKDLKLLEKEVRSKMAGSDVTLTEAEREEIAKLKEDGLTDYQKHSLDLLKEEVPYSNRIYELEQEIKIHNQIISATKLERAKSSPMMDAVKNASAIMEMASTEIVNMTIDDAKEHMEEEKEKQEKKAEATKEAKEEMEERIDAAKEKREKEREFMEEIVEEVKENSTSTTNVESAQQELKNMLNKLKLIEEDIKGAAVDKVL